MIRPHVRSCPSHDDTAQGRPKVTRVYCKQNSSQTWHQRTIMQPGTRFGSAGATRSGRLYLKTPGGRAASCNAEIVRRMRRPEAVFPGTERMHEFAQGGTTANPHYRTEREHGTLRASQPGRSAASGACASGIPVAWLLSTPPLCLCSGSMIRSGGHDTADDRHQSPLLLEERNVKRIHPSTTRPFGPLPAAARICIHPWIKAEARGSLRMFR